MKAFVAHGGYGCETGCCGHWVELEGGADKKGQHFFLWDHPQGLEGEESVKDWVKGVIEQEYGKQHVADIDWSQCLVVDDDEVKILGEW